MWGRKFHSTHPHIGSGLGEGWMQGGAFFFLAALCGDKESITPVVTTMRHLPL